MRKIYTAASLAVLFVANVCAGEPVTNGTLKTIHSRKSVRSYKDAPVSEDQLMTLVKAGMAAPTAVDRRPWDFIVITDKTVLQELAKALPYGKMVGSAPASIVVTGNLDRQFGGKESVFWTLDCSAATENILLAVESMGLGAVWVAVFPDKERIQAVRKVLGIPENVVPLNVIPVGVPFGNEKSKNKFNPDQIHRNRW